MPRHRRCCCGDPQPDLVLSTPSPGWRARWWLPVLWRDWRLLWAEVTALRVRVEGIEGRRG